MKHLLLISLIIIWCATAAAQEKYPYPAYPVPDKYRLKSAPVLPYKVDNTIKKFFPAVFNQNGMSCNQAGSIGYVLNYELNRLRDLSSLDQENLCSPGFVYNYLNKCSYGVGVSYFDSWEIVKTAGCAGFADYPYYFQGSAAWMSGYDKYYRAMQNRVIRNYSLPVATPEELQMLKQYLYNHFEDSPDGGIGNIQISSDVMATKPWTDPETGKSWPIIYTFGNYVGHCLTIAGYNDSVRVDLNNDGRFTNDIDISGDGEVTMRDWEIGAVLIVNSWGNGFWNGGKAYVLYSVLTRYGNNGGIWGRSVHVVKALKEYTPQLTMRVVMRHEQRNKIRILAGVGEDTAAVKPENILEFPMFDFMGNNSPLRDPENNEDTTRFEFGLDITPLLTHVNSGQPAKLFLAIQEKDALDQADGQVDEMSVILYNGEPEEFLSSASDVLLVNNGYTYIPLTCTLDFNTISVEQPAETSFTCGEPFSIGLQASGGNPPYRWELVNDYQEKTSIREYGDITGDTLADISDTYRYHRILLPFVFPFYGAEYTSFIADIKGTLHFDHEDDPYPYQVDEELSFKAQRSIVPFGADIQIKTGEDRMICQVSDTMVSIQWHASVVELLKPYPVNVTANLYDDGRIEFLYGEREIPAKGDYDWTVGISNGDSRQFKFAKANQNRMIFENYVILFTPDQYPDDLSLTDDGQLSGVARDTNEIWNIRVKVTDSYNQAQFAAIPISTVNWEEAGLLSYIYPNPLNWSTAIGFKLPAESLVTLEVFDYNGRKVKEILNTTLMAGEHTFYWNARDENNRDIRPGIYFYRLRAGERTETGRMVVVR